MLAYGLTEQDLIDSANAIGVECRISGKTGNALRFRLFWNRTAYPDDTTRYRHLSISWNGERKTSSVCFHGHYDFMFECFSRNKHARIKTAFADYRGRVDFFRKVPDVASKSLGAPIMGGFPTMIESCECGCYSYGIRHSYPQTEIEMLNSMKGDN